MNKKVAGYVLVSAILFSCAGCATLQEDKRKLTEKEAREESHVFTARMVGMFSGMVVIGMGALVTAKKDEGVTAALLGALIGSAAGFGIGHLVGENTKHHEVKPDDEKIKQRYKEYQWIKDRQ